MGKENRAAPIFIYGFPEGAQEEMDLSLEGHILVRKKKAETHFSRKLT